MTNLVGTIDIFEVGEFEWHACAPRWSSGGANIWALLPLDFLMLPGSRQKVRRSSADAVSCRVRPLAEVKKSPSDFSCKKNRNVCKCCKDSTWRLWAHNASQLIFIYLNMDCEWIGGCYIHKSLPLELLGPVTFREYIQTNKTNPQVGRILWLSWLIWLTQNQEISC
jgi:hypothetical protein